MSDMASDPQLPPTVPPTPGATIARKLPFTFAKRHGILVLKSDGTGGEGVYRPGISPAAVAEARRFTGLRLNLAPAEPALFDKLLQQAYEGGSGAAMQMVEGLEDTTDLAHLAQELPEPSDLMESEDDAPIIRLINAVLTHAV